MHLVINYLRKIFFKMFGKKEVNPKKLDYNFLRNSAKLALMGRVSVYKGGQKALTDALYDVNNTVYILIIKRGDTKKDFGERQWFKMFK